MNTSFPSFEEIKQNLQRIYNKIDHRGIDIINDYFPSNNENSDLFSERFKTIILCVCAFSVFMMVITPLGYLYACLPRPFYMFILYAMRLPNLPEPPSPEWGLHYVTLLTYSLSAWIGIEFMENQGIKKPFQKLTYIIALTVITFFVPFEFTYITLFDIFHNIPVLGYPAYWLVDYYRMGLLYAITHSVMVIDIVLTVCCFGLIYMMRKELDSYYPIKSIKFDRTSKILFTLFLLGMTFWILIPLVDPTVHSWGTQWFPQTIYVEYGFYADYGVNATQLGGLSDYGIVKEYWYPNDLVKYANHITKIFSVMFMFYTFLPRVDEKYAKKDI